MKSIVMIIGVVFMMGFMGCMLDETNQEKYQTHRINYPEKEIIIVKEYYDEYGVQITDPDIIEEIDNN